MTDLNAASATDDPRLKFPVLLAELENEMMHLCRLIDALAVLADALPCPPAGGSPYDRKAFFALGPMVEVLGQRADELHDDFARASLQFAMASK